MGKSWSVKNRGSRGTGEMHIHDPGLVDIILRITSILFKHPRVFAPRILLQNRWQWWIINGFSHSDGQMMGNAWMNDRLTGAGSEEWRMNTSFLICNQNTILPLPFVCSFANALRAFPFFFDSPGSLRFGLSAFAPFA